MGWKGLKVRRDRRSGEGAEVFSSWGGCLFSLVSSI